MQLNQPPAGGKCPDPIIRRRQDAGPPLYPEQTRPAKRLGHLDVYVDSPLAEQATKVYLSHPEFYDKEALKLFEFKAPGVAASLYGVSGRVPETQPHQIRRTHHGGRRNVRGGEDPASFQAQSLAARVQRSVRRLSGKRNARA